MMVAGKLTLLGSYAIIRFTMQATRNPSTLTRALVLFALALAVYTAPLVYNSLVTPFFHTVPSQDVVGASLVPVSVLSRGDFYLDQFRRFIANNYPEQHIAFDINGHYVSVTPVMAGVLALPFMGWGLGSGWIARTVYVLDVARLVAAFLTALSVLAFFFAARQLADLKTSTLVAVAYAFGSAVWTTASQGLWQHTPSILFQSLALFFVARAVKRSKSIAPAGLFLSLAAISRPPVILIALVFALFVLMHYRRDLVPFVLCALPPLLFVLAYNWHANGSPLIFGYQDSTTADFSIPRWEPIQGLLFSPSRGLFLFSPFLLLAPFGLWIGWKRERQPLFAYLGLAFVAYLGIMASWGSLGGWAYGPRMLTDTLPVMCLLIIPAVEKIRGRWRSVLWASVVFAIFIQALGLWDYGLRFHADPANSVWSIENNEPLFYLRMYINMLQEYLAL